MEFTLTFVSLFWVIVKVVAPVLVFQALIIVGLGQIAGRLEKWTPSSSLYWSFITATTVGYGDIRPAGRAARILAVVIALNGLILFGVVAAVAVSATTHAVHQHADLSEYEEVTGKDLTPDNGE